MGEDGAYEPIVSFEPDSWELAPDLITMENLLGEGGFGQVYMGILRGPIRTPGYETGTSLTVAVKLLASEFRFALVQYVSWCGGESWVDQRVPRAYIHDVALLL